MNNKTVYYPDKTIKQGYLSLFKEMAGEVKKSRWLTWQLFLRNFNALYRQSVLGIFWALLIPLISVGTFIYLNASGVFDTGEMIVPYPLFAIAGVALWQIFSMGVTLGAGSLVNASSMVTKINFPREPLVVSAVIQGIIPSIIQIVVVLILFVVYQIVPPVTILLVPFLLIPILMLTLGLGFIMALINGVFRDVGNSISVLVTFLMFVTPVLYLKPDSGIAVTVSNYNPLYYLVSLPRDLMLLGTSSEWPGYIYSVLFSFVLFLICWMAFHLTETRIAERI